MDRGVWWAPVHGVAKSQTQLSTHTLCYDNMLSYAIFFVGGKLK